MLPRHLAASLALLLVACGDRSAPTDGAASASASASARQATPTARPAALGEPCGSRIGRACGALLTCVVEKDGPSACLPLPLGALCGAFQCQEGEACCDADNNECLPPGGECTPRADAGRRSTICRRDREGCDPMLRCDHPEGSAFGVCVER